MNINTTSKTSWFVLLLALIVMILTVVLFGGALALIFACMISIMGGLATFLKSKDPILKTAGMAFFCHRLILAAYLPLLAALGSWWLITKTTNSDTPFFALTVLE